MNIKPLLFLILSAALFINCAFAEERLPSLSNGMLYGEVLSLWGQPKDKIEQEVKRRDIWVYKDSKVVFLEGKVESWVDNNALDDSEALPVKTPLSLVAHQPSDSKINDQEVVDDILSEIMKEPPTPDTSNMAPPITPPVGNMVRPGDPVISQDYTN